MFFTVPLYRLRFLLAEGNRPHGKKLHGSDLSPPGNFVFPLDDLYVLGLEALGSLGDGKLYRLAFLQAAESI